MDSETDSPGPATMAQTTENARRSSRTSTDESAPVTARTDRPLTDILSAGGLCLGVYGLLVLLTMGYQAGLAAVGW